MSSSNAFKQVIMVLPYKKKFGKVIYMVQRKKISTWDEHPDLCGILFEVEGELQDYERIELFSNAVHAPIKAIDIRNLGVCFVNRNSEQLCQLFALDVSHYDFNLELEELNSEEEHLLWADSEKLLTSLDPLLIATFAKAQVLVI